MEKTHSTSRVRTPIKTAEVFKAAPYSTELSGRPQELEFLPFYLTHRNDVLDTGDLASVGGGQERGHPEFTLAHDGAVLEELLHDGNEAGFGREMQRCRTTSGCRMTTRRDKSLFKTRSEIKVFCYRVSQAPVIEKYRKSGRLPEIRKLFRSKSFLLS